MWIPSPTGARDHLAVHHKNAVVVARDVVLEDHGRAVFDRLFKCRGHLLRVLQVQRYAAAVIRIERFDDDREPDSLGSGDSLRRFVDDRLARHGQPEIGQDLVGERLVASDVDGDVCRFARNRRLDPPLVFSVTELYEGLIVESDPGNVPLDSSSHE